MAGGIQGVVNKPQSFFMGYFNKVIGRFIKWAFNIAFLIVVVSFLVTATLQRCHIDENTLPQTLERASTAFEWWADANEKFTEILRTIADRTRE